MEILTFNLYDKLKDKGKKAYKQNSYIDEVINIMIAMFDYDNLPQATNKVVVETYLHGGACAIDKDGKAWSVTPKGLLREDFEFNEVIGIDILGNTFRGKNGKDCVVGYNNYTKMPSTFIDKFAYDMSQIDLSMECNLRYARMNKGFRVSTEKERIVYENAMKKANEGETPIFVSKNISELIEGENNNAFDLTDVEKIDRLQYLSNFREDTLKNFWRKYGLNMNGFTKMAQQSIDEVNDSAIFSMVIPTIMLECRKEFVNKVNDLFGFNISVKFSDLWDRQMKDATDEETSLESPKMDVNEDVEEGVNDNE